MLLRLSFEKTHRFQLSDFGGGAKTTSDKRYTLILKDELVARRPDGREASGVSYEYDFHVQPGRAAVVRVPWGRLTATYRGRPKEDAAPLDLKSVRRFSIMMRR